MIQPRDEIDDDDFWTPFFYCASLSSCSTPAIRNNAGGTWVKLEGKPPFLGHAAVAVYGLLLSLDCCC